jgi:hypothetical protein
MRRHCIVTDRPATSVGAPVASTTACAGRLSRPPAPAVSRPPSSSTTVKPRTPAELLHCDDLLCATANRHLLAGPIGGRLGKR